ncbi:hypothetical protein [Actinoplanes sp. NPDC051411]|uniref:hypothetical protein n=1 Tax=Actinoplanes sp. NPDC051411 TaxID=3155522 RepID=UPI003421878A
MVAAAWWLRHERRTDNPLIDLGIFANRHVSAGNLATVGLGWALFGSYLLVPQMIRADPGTTGYGLSASTATIGLLLVPLAVGQTAASPLGGLLERRLPARGIFAAGLLLVACGMGLLCLARQSAILVGVAVLLLGAGAGAGLQAGSSTATNGVAPEVAAASTAANSTHPPAGRRGRRADQHHPARLLRRLVVRVTHLHRLSRLLPARRRSVSHWRCAGLAGALTGAEKRRPHRRSRPNHGYAVLNDRQRHMIDVAF